MNSLDKAFDGHCPVRSHSQVATCVQLLSQSLRYYLSLFLLWIPMQIKLCRQVNNWCNWWVMMPENLLKKPSLYYNRTSSGLCWGWLGPPLLLGGFLEMYIGSLILLREVHWVLLSALHLPHCVKPFVLRENREWSTPPNCHKPNRKMICQLRKLQAQALRYLQWFTIPQCHEIMMIRMWWKQSPIVS